jgi:hypothetical protein
MPYLNWISDETLESVVKQLLDKAIKAQQEAKVNFGKNVIDPFSAIFEISGFEMDFDYWIKSETARQAQKTLQNHIGEFHQNILGSCKGWTNMKTGHVIDLVSDEKKIIAEIKNKYNTISGGKLADLFYSLEGLVMPKASIYRNYTSYYVAIIPKNPARFDREFTPSDKEKGEKCPSNDKIREIDGASFYSLVTGENDALENLFDLLPDVIYNCSNGKIQIANRDKIKDFFRLAFE